MPAIQYSDEPFKTVKQLRFLTNKLAQTSKDWFVAGWLDYFIFKERVKENLTSPALSKKLHLVRKEYAKGLTVCDETFNWIETEFHNWMGKEYGSDTFNRYRKYVTKELPTEIFIDFSKG